VIDLPHEREENEMSEENVEIVRGAYADFNSGNVPGVLGRLADNVEWIEPGGGSSPSGTFNGPDAVGSEVFAAVPEKFDEFSAEPADFTDDGDRVTVTGRFNGKAKSGAELDAAFEHTYELEDGKVTRFENKPDMEAWAAAWS
jgi:ketosteroid isomerase-like protein